MLRRLWLADFRNYEAAGFEPAPEGLTVIRGDNGAGKTNLLEAIGYLATLSSFRGAGADSLVRQGCGQAVIRAEVESGGRTVSIEVEVGAESRGRALVNHQPLRRSRDLLGVFRTTIFSPDDVGLVKGGPSERRRYLDEVLVAVHPRNDRLCTEMDRILRQRNALLRQAGGGRAVDAVVLSTLDVWDDRLAKTGEALVQAREELVGSLRPEVAKFYDQVAGTNGEVGMAYRRSWEGRLSEALLDARDQDLQRGVTTVGPHRDEIELWLGGGASGPGRLPARAQASQGEQRSLALALRLSAHAVVAEAAAEQPVLLLDDVFSELDSTRSEALLAYLPSGQAVLTTTGPAPASARVARTVEVRGARVIPAEPGASGVGAMGF